MFELSPAFVYQYNKNVMWDSSSILSGRSGASGCPYHSTLFGSASRVHTALTGEKAWAKSRLAHCSLSVLRSAERGIDVPNV